MKHTVETLQESICQALETLDTHSFKEDLWTRDGGGGGKTRILCGSTFEKAGVNTSVIEGRLKGSEVAMFSTILKQQGMPVSDNLEGSFFYATGISLVVHPHSPLIPTTHANYRYFELSLDGSLLWWFGGGADLTPFYLVEEDAYHFHHVHKQVLDRYDKNYYPTFKQGCDDYFYIKHRQETRGIGGIFYDYLQDKSSETLTRMSAELGQAFVAAYCPIVEKHKDQTFTDDQKKWQLLRRGRYAEFNLIYDRGTCFGLKTGGRSESILMSLPPVTHWDYNVVPHPQSDEAKLLNVLKQPRHWV